LVFKQGTYQPAPSGTLDTCRGGIELLLERFERTEGLVNGILERTRLQGTTVTLPLAGGRREVLPEERVVDVS
jgi:hypothetical protein